MISAQFWQISPLSTHCSELMAGVVGSCVPATTRMPRAIRAIRGQLDIKMNSFWDLEGPQHIRGKLEESKNVKLWRLGSNT